MSSEKQKGKIKQSGSPLRQDDYMKMVDSAPLAIAVHRQGQVVYLNKACQKLFALPENTPSEDLNVLDFSRPEDHAEIKQRIAHITNNNQDMGPYHLKMRRHGGQLFDAELHVSKLELDNEDRLIQVYIEDISARKDIERAMFDAEQRYRSIAEKNPHFICIIQDNLIVYSNGSANQALAESRVELYRPPQNFVDLLDQKSQKIWHGELKRLQTGQKAEPFVAQLQGTRQRLIPCMINIIPLDNTKAQNANFTQVLVVATDLRSVYANAQSDTKTTNHTANTDSEARQAIEQAQDELNAFVYAVSHDLRSPLHHISGFTDATLDEFGPQLESDGRGYLERVLSAVGHMTRLLDALLELSRLSHRDIKATHIDLSGLCQAVALDLQQDPKITEQLGTHSMDLQVEADLQLIADPDQLRVVVHELLHNAIKFSAAQDPVKIWFSRCEDDKNAATAKAAQTFCVRDQGVGFDMKQANRLFAPFQRLHAREQFSGTGMGLAKVRRVITRHGGKVWIESQPGQGTSVYFTIPDAAADS